MKHLHVSIANQALTLLEDEQPVAHYLVSTALKGAGERSGSEQTPRGHHIIRAMIGADAPYGAVPRRSARPPAGG